MRQLETFHLNYAATTREKPAKLKYSNTLENGLQVNVYKFLNRFQRLSNRKKPQFGLKEL